MKPASRRNTATTTLRKNCLAILVGIAITSSVYAQTPPPATTQYAIPSGDLVQVVNEISRRSGVQIVYDIDALRGLKSVEVRGSLTLQQALDQALRGSGLVWSQVNATTISIRKRQETKAPAAGMDPAAAADQEVVELETMIVRGSAEMLTDANSLNADIRRSEDDAQPYVVIGRDVIERTPANNVEELIRRVTTAEASSLNGSQSLDVSGTTSRINLRGLGANQTLVLVDGRRVASRNTAGSAEQPDINGIPLLSIERIEILPSTASGIYGGGATGGVVNIVLRRNYQGMESRLTYGDTFRGGGRTMRLDLSGGMSFNDGDTSLMLSGSYADDEGIRFGERDVYQRYRDHLLATNPSTLYSLSMPPLGTTSNIASSTGAPLTLKPEYGGGVLGSAFTYVPIGYAGPASDNGAGLIGNAGSYNLALPDTAQLHGGQRRILSAGNTLRSVSATLRHQFTPNVEAFADVAYSENRGEYPVSAGGRVVYTLTAAHAGNPFNQSVRVTTPAWGADGVSASESRDLRVVGGVKFKLPGNWRGAADYTWNRNRLVSSFPSIPNGQDLVQARSGELNLFSDLNGRVPDFSAFLQEPNVNGPGRTTANIAALRFSGPLPFSLPGGKPTLSLLAEHRSERLGAFQTSGPTFSQIFYPRSQSVDSVYSELLLPFVGSSNAIPLVDLLELQVAGRADRYDIQSSNYTSGTDPQSEANRKFSATSPTIGLRYKPFPSLMLRGSYARGFLPPGLGQLFALPAQPSSVALTDPERGDELITQVDVIVGGNPDLEPERSVSRSFGLVLTPTFSPGTRVSVDWTRIEKTGNIDAPLAYTSQADFEAMIALAPDRVIRDTDPASFGPYPVGPVILLDVTAVNLSSALYEAIDFAFGQTVDTEAGNFDFDLRATRQLKYESRLTPLVPIEDHNGEIWAVKWRGTASLNWERGPFTANYSVRYIGAYDVPPMYVVDQGSSGVPSQAYHDLFFGYSVPSDRGFLSGVTVQASITNLFDKIAPIDVSNASIGAYSTVGDIRGRGFRLAFSKSF